MISSRGTGSEVLEAWRGQHGNFGVGGLHIDQVDAYLRRPALAEAQALGSCVGQIHYARLQEWTTVIDADDQ